MANIDIAAFIEKSGIRKARFGGLEPDDVRQAMLALSSEYEKRLARAEDRARQLQQENAGLEKHCQSLTARNRLLTDQNVSLAGSSDNYSRQRQELSGQVSSMRDKNRSLTDQNAVLVLKNADLTRENERLKQEAEEARAALLVKGRALDEQKNALEAERQASRQKAQAEADALVSGAKQQAEEMVAKAKSEVDAIQRAARDQARRQAQELVDAAANEANEIQNIHQLRLNSLKSEIAHMDNRRQELADYLKHMAETLLDAEREARENAPAGDSPAPAGDQPLELHPIETPEVKLDLSETAIAKAAAELAAEAPEQLPDPEIVDPKHDDPAGEPLPDPAEDGQPETGTRSFTLVSEEDSHEVPGAIFSQPIVHQDVTPEVTEPAPAAGPRAPVMPVLEEDDDDLPGSMPAAPQTGRAAAPAANARMQRRRVLALHALRQLRRRAAGAM